MINVKKTVNENILILEIDLSERNGESTTGKSNIIATTHGFKKVYDDGEITFSLNVNERIPLNERKRK